MKKRISMLIFNIICLMLILASSVFGYSTNTIEIQAEQQNLTSFNGVYQTIAQPNPKTQVNKNSKAINKKLTYIAVFIEFNDSDSLTSYHLDDPECIDRKSVV